MATTPSISNITIARTNGFNGKSVSNITIHDLSFTLVGDSNISYTCTVTIDTAKYVREVKGGSTVTIDIGYFDTGNADTVNKRIDISVIGSNVPMVTTYTTLTIYKYSPPDVVASVARNENEQPVLTFIPTYQAAVAGASNTLSLFWVRCNVDGEVYETDLKGKTSPQVLVGTYDLAKAYQFTIAIKDSVRPSAIIKRVILPSAIPVIDIGADGKTVTFFGTSPNSADKNTLRVIGDEIALGDTSKRNVIIGSGGFAAYAGSERFAHLGYGTVVGSDGKTKEDCYYTLGIRKDESAIGYLSMAEGGAVTASGVLSHAEGQLSTASGVSSHAEGNETTASGWGSHAEGNNTTASGGVSHAEGEYTIASGVSSHAEGYETTASGYQSHAGGKGTIAASDSQTAIGTYNVENSDSKYLFIVGNGYSDSARSNALGVTANGHIDVQKNIYINTNGSGIFERDTDGTNRELIAMDGNNKLSIGYGQYQHGSRETVLQGGNKLSLRLKNPDTTWRPYYTKGDNMSITIQVGGYITNSGKDVTFQIPLSKPVIGSPTVTIASVDGLCVRQNNKYLYGSSASTFTKPSSYSCTLVNGNHIKITAKMANTTNVENNSACGIYASIKVTFS